MKREYTSSRIQRNSSRSSGRNYTKKIVKSIISAGKMLNSIFLRCKNGFTDVKNKGRTQRTSSGPARWKKFVSPNVDTKKAKIRGTVGTYILSARFSSLWLLSITKSEETFDRNTFWIKTRMNEYYADLPDPNFQEGINLLDKH